MKKALSLIAMIASVCGALSGQGTNTDSTSTINLEEVTVIANRVPILLKNNPGSISLVTPYTLSGMPKTVGAEEALRLVPGGRVENQHGGGRVHLSIRGQGILTERGLRGIGVLIDGIPLNDPSGFAPDLYDVDWATVKQIELIRGPAAGLYGGSSSGGVIRIFTRDGGQRPAGGELSQTLGSHGFYKSLVQVDGTKDFVDYRVSFSRSGGQGYRDHQAYWSNKLYSKINFHPSEKLFVTQIVSHIDYFHQNPEGLNLEQFDNLKQANPDARPFNEYQKTNRTTIGMHGTYRFSERHDIQAAAWLRSWDYKETSNKAAEYRTIHNPGVNFQYNLHFTSGKLNHSLGIGVDFSSQGINMVKLQSAADPARVESIDETNIETDSLLANQIIAQQNPGVFGLYKLQAGKFNLLGNVRYDLLTNKLTDKMASTGSAETTKEFSQVSVRIGACYNFLEALAVFANWSQGFIPPSTEELASNPLGYSGFNTHLVPATSNSYELGARGFAGDKLSYEFTGFLMFTQNDFFRFKQSGRGNQEVFYGNAGNSRRFGIETSVSWNILKNLNLQAAYTYANYTYTSATIDPVYTDTAYVLTAPPAEGQWLPNCPRHQLHAELAYSFLKGFRFILGTEYQSKWAIYTDEKAYNGELDPALYRNWQEGFNLYDARISYQWRMGSYLGECSLSVRNLTGETYMAFTEPDPDGNSYQPGPGREFFGSLQIRF